MNLEEQLRASLRREEPRPGFAAAVRKRTLAPRRRPWIRPAALALAAGLLLAGAGLEYRRYRGEQAKKQVLLALRITSRQWNKVMRQLMDGDRP